MLDVCTWNMGGFTHLPGTDKDPWVLVTAPGAASGSAPGRDGDSAFGLLVFAAACSIAHLITEQSRRNPVPLPR